MTKVIQSFIDKETDRLYGIGEDYAGERVEELTDKGFLEPTEVEEPVKKTTRRRTTKPKDEE